MIKALTNDTIQLCNHCKKPSNSSLCDKCNKIPKCKTCKIIMCNKKAHLGKKSNNPELCSTCAH